MQLTENPRRTACRCAGFAHFAAPTAQPVRTYIGIAFNLRTREPGSASAVSLDYEAARQFGAQVCTGIARHARSRDSGLQFRSNVPRTRPDEIRVSTQPECGY